MLITICKKTKNGKKHFLKMYIFVNCRKSNKNNFFVFSLYINEKIKMGKKIVNLVVVKDKNCL